MVRHQQLRHLVGPAKHAHALAVAAEPADQPLSERLIVARGDREFKAAYLQQMFKRPASPGFTRVDRIEYARWPPRPGCLQRRGPAMRKSGTDRKAQRLHTRGG